MSEHSETLFLFELLVEYIRLEKHIKVSDELALGVRLLDFPTLLINQPTPSGVSMNLSEQKVEDKPVECIFNRGKSCFFKMNLSSLHIQLSNTPLHAMVLDVTEENPRLIGSSLMSLAKVMDRIKQDVTKCGISSPSSHRERGLVAICNLAGERIGTISLRYKLVCLGASLLPHITEKREYECTGVRGGQQQHGKEKSSESFPLENEISPTEEDKSELDIQTSGQADARILLGENDSDVCDAAGSQTENYFEEDLTIFCPPHLYYSNTMQEKSKNEEDYNLLALNPEDFPFEDFCSDEEDKEEAEGRSSKGEHQKMTHTPKMSSSQDTSGVTPNILREALKQLPLLNALVTELSQLTGQNPPQSFIVNTSQAQIYNPASSEPSTGHENTPRLAQTLHKTGQHTGTHLKHLQPPRNCSTPIVNPAKMTDNQEKETLTGNKSTSKSHRKKLVYGTTKTFNLRLKKISPVKAKHRECMELLQRETQSRAAKVKTKTSSKTIKSSKRKSFLNQSPSLNEDIETVIQSVTVDSALQSTVTLKQNDFEQDSVSGKGFLLRRDLKLIHIPSVNTDSIPLSKEKHHSKLDQSDSQSDEDKIKFLVPTLTKKQSNRHRSTESSFSESSIDEDEAPDYADDFDSLESGDDSSPKPQGSPESTRTKTPKSPVYPDLFNSDSRLKVIQKRPVVLPVPVKALSPPRRSLMGTHTIQPHTHSSAFSSNDDERDKLASLQTVCFRKQATASDKVEESSIAESFSSSRGEKTESPGNHSRVQGFSVEPISSFEAQEVEELEDELGSLDFGKEYQHISELVVNKLPGYTL